MRVVCRPGAQHATIRAEKSQFQAVADTQLLENMSQVVLNRILAETEFACDVLVALSQENPGNNLYLAWREVALIPKRPVQGRRHPFAKRLQNICHLFATYPILPGHDATNGLKQQFRR